jgi:hypothetical protein
MTQLYGGKRPIWKGMSEPYESLCGFCPFTSDLPGASSTGESVELVPDVASVDRWTREKSRARKSRIREAIQADLGCPDVSRKIFLFRKIRKCDLFTLSRLGKRGVRVVTNARRDAVDAVVSLDERRYSRTAKSCGPGAPTLALSFRGSDSMRVTGAKEPGPRGEHEIRC